MEKEKSKVYDLLIIGGGPAGLNAALYASRAGLDTALLEGMIAGGKLMNTNEVENWIGDTLVGGADLAMRMVEHAFAFGAEQLFGQVEHVRDLGDVKEVETFDKIYQAKAVLIAVGTVERKLGIPGEDEFYGAGVSYCAVCDGAFYKGRTVTVIGGGNTALEESDYLTRFADKVHLVLRRNEARADKIYQDRVKKNPKIEVHLSYSPIEIIGENGKLTKVRFKSNDPNRPDEMELLTDGLFPLIGEDPNTAFVKNLGITNEKGYILTDEKMATVVPGIYAAGDCRDKELRQIVTASNDGAIAAQAVSSWLS